MAKSRAGINEGARATSPRREIGEIGPKRAHTIVLRCPYEGGKAAHTPNFAGFSGDCRRSQTAWRREGDLNPRDPSAFGLPKTPRVRPLILRSFSETSHREFIRHQLGAFQTYPGPLNRGDVASRGNAVEIETKATVLTCLHSRLAVRNATSFSLEFELEKLLWILLSRWWPQWR